MKYFKRYFKQVSNSGNISLTNTHRGRRCGLYFLQTSPAQHDIWSQGSEASAQPDSPDRGRRPKNG